MKKLYALIAGFSALMTASSAFGLAGGPFDNGGSSFLAETNGTYQAIFTFQDGSGYAYFTPNNSLQPSVSGSGSAVSNSGINSTVQIISQPLSIYNRSVIYYQGITYVGMAAGATDLGEGLVQGTTNGTSDNGSTALAGGAASGTIGAGGTSVVNNNGAGLVANTNFTAHIIQNAPIIRFSGHGELSIISPNGFAAAETTISQVVQQAYTNLSSAITTTYSTANTLLNSQTTTLGTGYSNAANQYVTGFFAATPNPTPAQLATLISGLGQISNAAQNFTLAAQQNNLTNLALETNDLENLASNAAAALVAALTPPSASDIANKYTNTITMEVTGSLKYGLNVSPPAAG